MSAAYVDTSALLAMEFNEVGGEAIAGRLNSFSSLFSANLMEAELRKCLRESKVKEGSGAVVGGQATKAGT